MAKVVKVKNTKIESDTWAGQLIAPDVYYQIQDGEFFRWRKNSKVFTDIASGDLLVNNGSDDIADPVKGWNWLVGETEPPRTADGDWHVVSENFAHVSGNEEVNWTIEKYLDANTAFEEVMIVPDNRTFTLNFLEGGAFTVPTHIKLEWFEDIGGGVFMRRNPDIRIEEIYKTTVNGVHAEGETVIVMNNSNNELNNIEPEFYHGFKDGANTTFYRKVVSVDTGSNTITLETGLPAGGVSDGTLVGLTDRVIGQKANQIASSIINWISPPRFYGNGVNYLKITLSNEDSVDAGLVTAMINGWHTDSTIGD